MDTKLYSFPCFAEDFHRTYPALGRYSAPVRNGVWAILLTLNAGLWVRFVSLQMNCVLLVCVGALTALMCSFGLAQVERHLRHRVARGAFAAYLAQQPYERVVACALHVDTDEATREEVLYYLDNAHDNWRASFRDSLMSLANSPTARYDTRALTRVYLGQVQPDWAL